MPLLPGKSHIGDNIAELIDAGHPRDQAIAIAEHVAKEQMLPQANISLPPIHDPDKYVCVPNVAVLDEATDEADLPFTPAFLKAVCESTNERIAGGDLVVLFIGHTDDGPETEQPEPVGYATKMQIGNLNGRQALLADLYIQRDRYEEVMTYPRRSAELWHDNEYTDGYLDAVSFLRRTPARNLGLLTMKKPKKKLNRKSRYIKSQGEQMTEDEIKMLAKAICEAMSDKADDEPAEEPEKKDEYEAGEASGTDTFVPGEIEEKKAKKMRKDSERIKLTRLEKRISEMETEKQELAKANELLVLKLRRSERERDLKQLEAEGYQFDAPEELAHVEVLDDNAYATHLARMRKLYKRVPVGSAPIRLKEEPKNPDGQTVNVNEVMKFARQHKLSFEDAVTKYQKENI